ncbi:uncharacterized protein LOC131951988 [Physella acuta]|uniref:uncharacterized protein LOC131951988 n=1 Tax=Physella acuta TaxID=109671 RepID=UPI0027DDB25A|nr:uncharacterized protein LOC131951988 [Physella acuta]
MAEVAPTIIIVPPREILIRKFHGDSHGYEVDRFIKEVQSLWKARGNLSVEERKDLLWQYLGEAVREELSCRGDDLQHDPEATLRLLREVYGEKRRVPQLMAQFQMVVQGQHESVRAYSHRLHRAFKTLVTRQSALQVPQTDAGFLRDQFVENLSQATVRRHLHELIFRDPKIPFLAIRDAAIRWSGDKDPLAEPAYVAAINSRPIEKCSFRSKLEDKVNRLTEQLAALLKHFTRDPKFSNVCQAPRKRTEVQSKGCFNCHQRGHLARHCHRAKKYVPKGNQVTPKVWRGDKVLRPRERTLVPAKGVPTIQATEGDSRMKDDKVVQPLDQPFHPDPSVVSGPTSCLRASITSVKVDQSEELEAMVPPNPSLIKAPGGGAGACPQTESSKKDKQVKKAPVAELAIGDLVLLRQPPLGRRKMADLDGPTVYVVVELPPITGGGYAIKKKDGPSGTRRVASTQIRRYVPPKAQPPSPRPVKVVPPAATATSSDFFAEFCFL